jgi:hypothetical protein
MLTITNCIYLSCVVIRLLLTEWTNKKKQEKHELMINKTFKYRCIMYTHMKMFMSKTHWNIMLYISISTNIDQTKQALRSCGICNMQNINLNLFSIAISIVITRGCMRTLLMHMQLGFEDTITIFICGRKW